jgi:glycosyltransferase involved in cell wall biosynthesis
MTSKEISVVTTTINKPTFLEDYIQNAIKNEYPLDNLSFIVVGDLKTPLATQKYCRSLVENYSVDVIYMSVDDQSRWLDTRGLNKLGAYLPYNSIQRRNIGYLHAYEQGADVIISLDDDNLARDDDIFGKFATVGEEVNVLEATSSNDWYNCASMMDYEQESSRDVYHRGFPYSKRGKAVECDFTEAKREIAIRAGLWVDVPDIDVITHLERSPRATSLRDEFEDIPVALGDETYCPVNTQNTAFDASMMPLIHTIPMGDEIGGMELSRFDDIWLGFFAEKILHSMGRTVAYGTPLSRHDRNTHHLKRELEHEAIGIRLNEVLIDILDSFEITESDYQSCYRELIEKFRDELHNRNVDYEFRAYFEKMLDGMEIWTEACNAVMD